MVSLKIILLSAVASCLVTLTLQQSSSLRQEDKVTKPKTKRVFKCDTKKKQLRLKPDANDTRILDDLGWFCSKDPCGRQATDLVFVKPQRCLVEKIKNSCPNVVSIEIGDAENCECFCNKMDFVRGSGTGGFVKCPSCNAFPPNYSITKHSPVEVLALEQKKESSTVHWQGVQISILSISIPAVLLALVGVYCIKFKSRQGITLFRNRNAGDRANRAARPYTDEVPHRDFQSPRSLDAESLLTTTTAPAISTPRERSASVLLEVNNGDHSIGLVDIENDAAQRQHVISSQSLIDERNHQRNLLDEELIQFAPETATIEEERELDSLLGRCPATAAN